MSYIKCYWGQFVILDMEYMAYFSNYKKNDKEPIYNNLKKTKSFKDLIHLNTEYDSQMNTLRAIYETQFEFDEDIYNATSNNTENNNRENNNRENNNRENNNRENNNRENNNRENNNRENNNSENDNSENDNSENDNISIYSKIFGSIILCITVISVYIIII